MDEQKWHDTWIATLIGNGFSQRQAHHIFFVCYGNQTLDLSKDPIADASMFVPTVAGEMTGDPNGWPNLLDSGFDGLSREASP
jgi:hypothetical protein